MGKDFCTPVKWVATQNKFMNLPRKQRERDRIFNFQFKWILKILLLESRPPPSAFLYFQCFFMNTVVKWNK